MIDQEKIPYWAMEGQVYSSKNREDFIIQQYLMNIDFSEDHEHLLSEIARISTQKFNIRYSVEDVCEILKA